MKNVAVHPVEEGADGIENGDSPISGFSLNPVVPGSSPSDVSKKYAPHVSGIKAHAVSIDKPSEEQEDKSSNFERPNGHVARSMSMVSNKSFASVHTIDSSACIPHERCEDAVEAQRISRARSEELGNRIQSRWTRKRMYAVFPVLLFIALFAVYTTGDHVHEAECWPALLMLPEGIVCLTAAMALVLQLRPSIAGVAGRHTSVCIRCLLVWSTCLIISMNPPSRRCHILGLQSNHDVESCNEGVTSLWVAVVLGVVAICHLLPFVVYVLLSQLICLQHLLLCISSPCSGGDISWNPTVISPLQLYVLVAQFSYVVWRQESIGTYAKALRKFSNNRLHKSYAHLDYGNDRKGKGWLLELLDDMLTEDQECREMISYLQKSSPRAEMTMELTTAFISLADTMTKWTVQLHSKAQHLRDQKSAKTSQLCEQIHRFGHREEKDKPEGVAAYLEQQFMTGQEQEAMEEHPHRDASSTKEDAGSTLYNSDSGSMNSASIHSDMFHSEDEKDGQLTTVSTDTDLNEIRRRESQCRTEAGRFDRIQLGQWCFDALKLEEEEGRAAWITGFELLHRYPCLERYKLGKFLEDLHDGYDDRNPYHMQVHAADVCNSVYWLVDASGLWPELNAVKQMSLLLAALGHDLGHWGRNNMFLLTSRHSIATTYNDRSILENFHAASLFRLLEPDRITNRTADRSKGLLSELSNDSKSKARQFMIALILATDTQHHLEDLSAFTGNCDSMEALEAFDTINSAKDQQSALCFIFRTADISHAAKPFKVHSKWSARVCEEFHLQGDEEMRLGIPISPLCDRRGFSLPKSQIGFLRFICLPTFTIVSRFTTLLGERLTDRAYHSDKCDEPSTHEAGEKGTGERGERRISTGESRDRGERRISWSCPAYGPLGAKGGRSGKSSHVKCTKSMSIDVLQQCESNFQEWERLANEAVDT